MITDIRVHPRSSAVTDEPLELQELRLRNSLTEYNANRSAARRFAARNFFLERPSPSLRVSASPRDPSAVKGPCRG